MITIFITPNLQGNPKVLLSISLIGNKHWTQLPWERGQLLTHLILLSGWLILGKRMRWKKPEREVEMGERITGDP